MIKVCQTCGKIDGVRTPVSTSNNWYGRRKQNADGSDYWIWCKADGTETAYYVGGRIYRKPTPQQLKAGLDEGKQYKDIHGTEIRIKPDWEVVRITEVVYGKTTMLACEGYRGRIVQKRKNAKRLTAADETTPMFDDLAEMDARGKAKRVEERRARLEAKKPPEFLTD